MDTIILWIKENIFVFVKYKTIWKLEKFKITSISILGIAIWQ